MTKQAFLLSLTLVFSSAKAQVSIGEVLNYDQLNNKSLLSDSDVKEEEKRRSIELKAQREREEVHRRVYKTWSDKEKDEDVWTTWSRKKIIPALLQLSKMRKTLFSENLFDNYVARPELSAEKKECGEKDKYSRRIDGTCNNLNDPMEGASWSRMGRNVSPTYAQTNEKDLFYPDPRKVSRVLLGRKKFQPVPFLNLFAVSWIQFMTHDWFSHGANEPDGAYKLVLEDNDPLRVKKGLDYLLIQRT